MVIRRLYIIVLMALAVLIHWGCTELGEGGKVHPDDWADPDDALHGDKIRAIGLSGCAECHGANFSGGTSEVACSECHSGGGASPHPPLAEFVDPTHENYHGRIFWLNNWDFSGCQSCHGDDLAGGVVNASCSNTACHTASGGVFACDNCHYWKGDAGDFEDVQNRTDSTLMTVGAHTSYILSRHSLTIPLDCSRCHVVPDSVFAAGHLEDSDSDVTFDSLATAKGTLSPVWDPETATCADTYCHGSFRFEKAASSNGWIYADSLIVGNNQTIAWTGSLAGDNLCANCHGYPPTGHLQLTNCGNCHTSVVGTDHLSIIDTQKHINGRADYP